MAVFGHVQPSEIYRMTHRERRRWVSAIADWIIKQNEAVKAAFE